MKMTHFVSLAALQWMLAAGQAAVFLTPEPNGHALQVENETLRLLLDPDRGGAVVSFIHKQSGRDIVQRQRQHVGLFLDHFWGQTWPGELLEQPYEFKVVKQTPEEVSVRVWRTVTGHWKGTDQKMLRGLVVERTLIVRAGVDAVFCHVAVRNALKEGRLPAYWMQHVFFAGGDYDETGDIFFRPSARGVRIAHKETKPEDFLRDPLAGWSAAVDTEKKQGLVFLMDYNDLDMLYNCRGNLTLEWMYDKIPVPAGRAWETDVVLIPTEGIARFAHASRNLIAGLHVERQGDGVLLTHTLRGGLDSVRDVRLTTEILGAVDGRRTTAPPLVVGRLDLRPRQVRQRISPAAGDPLWLAVTATGRGPRAAFSEKYYLFFPGSYGYGDNVQQDLTTPLVKAPRPPKRQTLMRPAKIERPRDDQLIVFTMEGLHTAAYRLDAVLAARGAVVHRGAYSIGQAGPRIGDFPFDFDTLMAQDLIIVANTNIQCLGHLGLEMLRDYLTHGGSLLCLGGKSAYAGGGLRGSEIADLLPVRMKDGLFDIKGPSPARLTAAGASPLLAGVRLSIDSAQCPYLHIASPAPAASVVLLAGEHPFLVTRQLPGGGRVACVLGAPYGNGSDQAPVFFRWRGWPRLLGNLVDWLVSGR